MKNANTITSNSVPSNRMASTAHKHFGGYFAFTFEPFLYDMTRKLSEDYDGGEWRFYTLSNGGFYMSPKTDRTFRVSSPNGNDAVMSANALGIAACLIAYSNLSFSRNPRVSQLMAEYYHRLYAYTYGHKEENSIRRIID